ncbi:LuxR C-terminal-related transcriptional regulator [Streptomyces sp. QH1-20]|uniref:LuxR C-terminal-related transcriptional regulator n=1 Tax=Streptomyces sp. QH1-20 TaxID=3240934 RepID=UPI003516CB44
MSGISGYRRVKDFTRLTATEVRVLEAVADGLTNEKRAERLSMGKGTYVGHLTSIRGKLLVSGRAAQVHTAYLNGQLARTEAADAPADFSEEDLRLWHLVATTTAKEIGQRLNLSEHTTRGRIRDLMKRAGARSESHLVKLGRAYRVLGAEVTAR